MDPASSRGPAPLPAREGQAERAGSPGSPQPGQPAEEPRPGGGPAVLVADAAWRRLVPGAVRLARRAGRAAGGEAATVVLASDAAVKRLNARHRGRNKPTNVLTFESGDLILAVGVVRREARTQGRRPAHHLAHLVVHGCLHLHGHDHHGAGEARRMEMREARILHRLRVPNPWKPAARAVGTEGAGV